MIIRRKKNPALHPGFTLIEMLVAMAVTLLMMASVATIFSQLGTAINDSRSGIEMSSRLRHVRNRLQLDLAGHTCQALPWRRPEAGEGFLEIVEGPRRDFWWDANSDGQFRRNDPLPDPSPTLVRVHIAADKPQIPGYAPNPDSLVDFSALGDYDDLLMLTVRSRGEPFAGWGRVSGKPDPVMVESPVAEVIWYAVENPDAPAASPAYRGEPGMRTLYRRVLLVAPWVDLSGTSTDDVAYYNQYDISSHVVPTTGGGIVRVANSLADLTKREYRFAHEYREPRVPGNLAPAPNLPVTFPHAVDASAIQPRYTPDATRLLQPFLPGSPREGEDLMLDSVLAFDVRVYDPTAPLRQDADSTTMLTPGDRGWYEVNTAAVADGAFVDLNYLGEPWTADPAARTSIFATLAHPKSDPLRAVGARRLNGTYDTWSFHYEHDGIDQDNRDGDNDPATGVDEGTDGFDNDGANGVDDIGERETSPPYPVPLRAVQVRVRVYEPTSRQIREVSIEQSFVPE